MINDIKMIQMINKVFVTFANNVSGKMPEGFGLKDLPLLSALLFHSFVFCLLLSALQLFALCGVWDSTQGMMHMWGSADNPQELVLSFHHLGPRDGT